MLVLTRRSEESIVIRNSQTNEVLEFQFIDTRFGRSRVGIDAPKHYEILRGELIERDDSETERIRG